MDRGVVHACHAGGVVHLLEGWTHHEVGALDVDRIDVVWNAALKHGLKPVSNSTKQNSMWMPCYEETKDLESGTHKWF